jgi:signal transduction histidine kinase
MLKRTPSLSLRAGLIFMSAYAAFFLAVIALSAAVSWADRGENNHRGAFLAVNYAAAELRETEGGWQLPRDGRFANLAARNPSIWLIVVKDGRSFTIGAVPGPAPQTVARLHGVVDSVFFRVPGIRMPLAVGALERREMGSGSVILAAGGVDPVTLSTVESIHLLLEPEVAGMLAVIAVIALLAMLIVLPSFSRALRPITIEAAAIGPQDPGRRLDETEAPKELLPLVRGFNAALDRLEIELGRRKRFIADVAHELRTPLAVVSLQIESLLDGDRKEDLRRGLGRLTHLVAQMLDLERLSLSHQQSSHVDLVETARDLVAELAPMAIGRGYDLSLVAPDTPVIVSGDVHAISRAITNLLGNAVAHGGCSGRITVVVGADRTIDVSDEGPGVAVDLRPRLFEPFSRGNPKSEGCGLGLHLTREIMSAHGGEVCLVPAQRGATFRLRFAPPDGKSCRDGNLAPGVGHHQHRPD